MNQSHHGRTAVITGAGKVERHQQALAREWGYGLTYSSSEDRDRSLPHWLDHSTTVGATQRSGVGRLWTAFGPPWGRAPSPLQRRCG